MHKRFWLAKQVMLCAMNLMLAAEAAGLSTLPMEGFDEGRVRKVLGIPRTQVVPVIVAVGYALPQTGARPAFRSTAYAPRPLVTRPPPSLRP